MKRTGCLIVIDGIGGSGKSTVIKALLTEVKKQGKKVFDLREWEKIQPDPPSYDQINSFDTYFTYEPTRSWIGATIRHEMSRTDQPYSGFEVAQAFSLNRLVSYKRLILPALQDGKTIIQDRSVSSSIVYQPIMANGPELEDLLEMSGNKLALAQAPDHLILLDIPPEVAATRLSERKDESRGVFADPEYLRRVQERFHSDWLKKLFEKNNCKIHKINTNQPQESVIQEVTTLLESILS